MFIELFTIFCASFASLFICRKAARNAGLVDKPNERKFHEGAIPLVGGISIAITLIFYILNKPGMIQNQLLFVGCISALVILGSLDDKFDISFKIRLVAQLAISLIMIYAADLKLLQIGDAFGFGTIALDSGLFSTVFTVFAVIGAINAFNMVDGIDGLLGGLAIVTLGSIAFMLKLDNQAGLAYLCLVFIVAMIPYIMMNLGLLGRERKVFMGDAGSTLIGFSIIWILLSASQDGNEPLMRPVTCLWIIAIPLMDMAAIMVRRIRRGDSPFKPDREHLHHVFQRLGLSSRQTLLAICTIASLFASFGIYGEIIKIPEFIMFYLFCGVFIAYAVILMHVWKITSFFRRKKAELEKSATV